MEKIITEKNFASIEIINWIVEPALIIEKLKKEIFLELDGLAPVETPLFSAPLQYIDHPYP